MSREMEYSKKKSIDIVQEHLTVSSSNNPTSLNNEDAAAVALVETIETNQESGTLTSSNDSFIEKDEKLNNLESEDQEVNIIHGDDHDIFEYQPHELESHLKSELSQVEPPVSSLTDESKITSEISDANEIEEVNDKSKDEQTKLDDLDDLVLGSTSKSGTSEVLSLEGVANTQERHSISAQDNDLTALNSSSYQYNYPGQDNQYNEQWVSNDVNYQYQEYDSNQIIGDTTTSSEQVDYKYQGNDSDQTTRDNVNYHYEPTTTEKEQSIGQYSNRVGVDNINQTNYQYDSSQVTVENPSVIYQNNYQHSESETNQSTAVDATIYHGYDMTVDATAEQEQSNYQYQAYETSQATIDNKDATHQANYQYTRYDTNQINNQASTDQTNYHYQGYETSQVDTHTGIDQSNNQYYQGYQPITTSPPQNSPPPVSPSPKGTSLISCPDPQCRGENRVTAKYCSDCGKPINNIMNSMTTSEVIGNTNIYNNLNAYSKQSLPYSHSQASYSVTSFTSYGNQLTSMNDTQYPVLDTHQLDQQQYYSSDDINDPLGRSKGCRPIVAFGFGGKIYTMFPRTVQRFTSTDHSTPITKSAPGAFTIRVLKDIIPVSDIEDFPGPLLMDNNRGGVKAKKKNVLKFLNDQIQVSENNISFFNDGEVEKKKFESILIVWNLFKIMFENEGALIGRLV
jgi:hypothetical protein